MGKKLLIKNAAELVTCRGKAPKSGEAMAAWIETRPEDVVMRLDSGCRGVAPGQYAVCYDGERVVGSSVISGAS